MMQVFSRSDTGIVRKQNQDSCRTGVFDEKTVWAVVCDGMGGANGGSIASATAVDEISEYISENYKLDFDESSIKQLLADAASIANNAIYERSISCNELSGMGTTLVAAIVKENKLYIIHAGDSRACLIADESFIQLTQDHSIVQEMVDMGEITPEQARVHPKKNIITRALGVEPRIRLDFTVSDFPENSIFMICTDGLTNYISPEKMVELYKKFSGDELTEALVAEANEQGGGDNITVVIINR